MFFAFLFSQFNAAFFSNWEVTISEISTVTPPEVGNPTLEIETNSTHPNLNI